ncbi:MAG: ATP-dependent RNA helicase HrpA, partial [Deltaproteobacteria bacterium]|nr:ATP-dependent RNA helicase HrpA [Deltaproteobacteria bacterium]
LIVDEAHERSINIDFILGLLRRLLRKRKDLKLIITSATIDPEKFSKAFDRAPIIEVSGRMYPVDLRYLPLERELEEREDVTYVDAAVDAVGVLKKEADDGHILVFMPTEQDIRETCDHLAAKKYRNTRIFPLFARLSSANQRSVFRQTKEQKIIVATNVAETSITIPGIRYVVDTGLARISEYNPRTRTRRLPVSPISGSSADQRKGRCGRVQKGICVRLYPKEDYESRPKFTPPEIMRSNLAEVILKMISLRLGAISSFPFIDSPSPQAIWDGFSVLEELGAIRESGKKRKGEFALTGKGEIMARLPIDPRISRMIIEAEKEGCDDEIFIIAAALSIQDPRERPVEREEAADRAHKSFINPSSDFITLLNMWNHYKDVWETTKSQNGMRRFCRENFLSYRRMREWRDVYDQIRTIIKDERRGRKKKLPSLQGESLYTAIHKAILSGYLSNIAFKKERNIYSGTRGREFMIFPGSGIFNRGGDWIVAAETVETSRLFVRTVATISNEWIEEVGGELCRSTYSEPHWERDRGEVVASETVTLYGLKILTGRRVSYGAIDSSEATKIFIRSALVDGDIKGPPPFLVHNKKLIKEITSMENKIRRRNILADESAQAAFYEERLDTVYDIRTLNKLIKGNDKFLRMTEENILQYYPEEELSLYPDEIVLGNKCLPCTYRFDPGRKDDGITLTVPAGLLNALPLDSADVKIPGLLREKITALIRGLPKEFRRKLVPIPETVDLIMEEMNTRGENLLSDMGRFIYQRWGISIPAAAWPMHALPDYLKMRFSVVDEMGRVIGESRDIAKLQKEKCGIKDSSALRKLKAHYEREGLTLWDFGDLPESVDLKMEDGLCITTYPALEKGERSVNIRLFNDPEDARKAHKKGMKRLYELNLNKEMKFLKKSLAMTGAGVSRAARFGGVKYLETAIYERILDELFDFDIRHQKAFFRCMEDVKPIMYSTGQGIVREVEPVLVAYQETRVVITELKAASRASRPHLAFLEQMIEELDRLVPENFIATCDKNRLYHMPRLIKAIRIRAERGIVHLEKDRLRAKQIREFSDALARLRDKLPPYSSKEKISALEELSWMIEEYKVSIFAQELKTALPVSSKRLREKIKEIDRIV